MATTDLIGTAVIVITAITDIITTTGNEVNVSFRGFELRWLGGNPEPSIFLGVAFP
jgi:hypothetical protein